MAQGASTLAFVLRPLSLSIVLNHLESAAARNGHDWIHISGLTIKMNRDNSLGALCDSFLNAHRINIAGFRIRLDWYWNCACVGNRKPRRDVGIRRDNNFVSWPDVQRSQDQVQSIQAITNPDAVFDPAIVRELLLEAVHFSAENVPSRIHEAKICFVQFRLQFNVRTF